MDQKIVIGMVIFALIVSIVALVMTFLSSSSSKSEVGDNADVVVKRVTDIADGVKKLDERVIGIETKVADVNGKFPGIESKIADVTTMAGKISGIESRISEVEKIGIEKKMSEMEGRFAKEDSGIRRDLVYVQDKVDSNHTQIMTYIDRTIDSFNDSKDRENIKKMLGYVDWVFKS